MNDLENEMCLQRDETEEKNEKYECWMVECVQQEWGEMYLFITAARQKTTLYHKPYTNHNKKKEKRTRRMNPSRVL